MTLRSLLLLAALTVAAAPAAAGGPDAERIRARVGAGAAEALELYRELLRYPNDALFPDDMATLVAWLHEAFRSRGFETASYRQFIIKSTGEISEKILEAVSCQHQYLKLLTYFFLETF